MVCVRGCSQHIKGAVGDSGGPTLVVRGFFFCNIRCSKASVGQGTHARLVRAKRWPSVHDLAARALAPENRLRRS